MPPRTLAIVGFVVLICVALLAIGGGSAPTTQPQSPISLKDVYARGIEGRLGMRLGTIAEISGDVVPNTSKAKADDDEPFFLKITAVDGKPLAEPVLYPFIKQNSGINVAPKIGDKFRFVGFETGRFDGSPDGELKYVPAYATTGFGFHTRFVVLAAK